MTTAVSPPYSSHGLHTQRAKTWKQPESKKETGQPPRSLALKLSPDKLPIPALDSVRIIFHSLHLREYYFSSYYYSSESLWFPDKIERMFLQQCYLEILFNL